MTETANDVRDAVRRALSEANTHSDLIRRLMVIVYPTGRPLSIQRDE